MGPTERTRTPGACGSAAGTEKVGILGKGGKKYHNQGDIRGRIHFDSRKGGSQVRRACAAAPGREDTGPQAPAPVHTLQES